MIGAFGGVGTTVTLGLAALARGLTKPIALTTELPLCAGLDLPPFDSFIIGGHELRETSFMASADEFVRDSRVFDRDLVAACREDLEAASARVKPGTKMGANPIIARLGPWGEEAPGREPAAVIERLADDMNAFVDTEAIDHLIVLNVASTEPPHVPSAGEDLKSLPSSALYAMAALKYGHTYINFTPSLGSSFTAARVLAEKTGALYAGKDGKTGETLMKTVLAPMFAHRNLRVMSWVGHNIFGNRDGLVLDDPANKAAKVGTKDWVVHQILGYKPNTLVTIEYVPDMGDWKTAWDHIHFQGFLGTPMTLQFTWQGCDSLLAAPLAIDLARLADLEKQRGAKGLMTHLAAFFKGPEGVETNDFFDQFRILKDHLDQVRATNADIDPS